jgi:hypothetical protein
VSLTVPLQTSVSVVLSGTGAGSVTIGPQTPGIVWYPSGTAVTVTPVSTTVISQFSLYNGNAGAANFIGGTYTGDNNSNGITGITMYTGAFLTGVWTGGNPGARATLTVIGTMTIPG